MVVRSLALCALSLAGCFGPDAREGLRCSAFGRCPDGQHCYQVDGQPVCLAAPPGDAADPDNPIILFGVPVPVELMCDTGETPCRSPRDPALTDNRTQMVFTIDAVNAAGDRDVYLARRATAEDMWDTAAPAGAIDTTLVEEGSWMTGNGLALYFARDDQAVAGPPYDDLWVSERVDVTAGFDTAAPVAGAVNTSRGSERWAARTADGSALVFARALEGAPDDHDLYLARDRGGQWDTVAHLPQLSAADGDERSLAVVEEEKTLFFSRGEHIIEARWTGDDLATAEVFGVHDELLVAGATLVSGVWASADAKEIWFGACTDTCDVYRAIR